MLAFKNDKALKEFYVARVEGHRAADEIARGFYWDGRRGCAIGCLAHVYSGAHAKLEQDTNIPAGVSYLADRIFEGLPDGEYKDWPTRFTTAIKEGSDLSLVTARFNYWLLSEEVPGFFKHAKYPDVLAAVNTVAALYKRRIDGQVVENSEWEDAAEMARNARSAAAYAAYAADAADAADAAAAAAYAADAYADAYAAAAAYAAAYAAYAADAADAAAYAAYAADARRKMFSKMADKLIELLENA